MNTTTDTPLEGKTALVTGASAGIGKETVRTLARYGSDVVLAARREERLEGVASSVAAEHDVETLSVPTDVTSEAEVQDLVEASLDAFGTIDVVVNNAGTGTARSVDVEDLDTEQYRTVMGVNTDGMFFVTRETLPPSGNLRERWCSSAVSPASTRARRTHCTRRRSGGRGGSR